MSNKVNQVSSSKNYGDDDIKELVEQPYKYGFKTLIETEDFPKGLNAEIIIIILLLPLMATSCLSPKHLILT